MKAYHRDYLNNTEIEIPRDHQVIFKSDNEKIVFEIQYVDNTIEIIAYPPHNQIIVIPHSSNKITIEKVKHFN